MGKKLNKKTFPQNKKKSYFYYLIIAIVSIIVTVVLTGQSQSTQTLTSNAQVAFPTAGILGPGPEGGAAVQQSTACSNGQCVSCTGGACSIQCTDDQCTCTGGNCQTAQAPSTQPTASYQPGITVQPTPAPSISVSEQPAGENSVSSNSKACANGKCVTCTGGACSIQCTNDVCTCTGGECQDSTASQSGASQQASQAGKMQDSGVNLIQQLTDLIGGFFSQIKGALAGLFSI